MNHPDLASGTITGGNHTRRVRHISARIRFQLLGGLVFAVALPALIRWRPEDMLPTFSATGMSFDNVQNSIVGTAIAVICGFFVLRQLASYPGTNRLVYPLPIFMVIFGMLILVLFFMRLDYSRYQIFASFMCSVVWFTGVLALTRTHSRLRLAVVPGGDLRNITTLPGVFWLTMDTPERDLDSCDGIVADLRHDFSEGWQKLLVSAALSGRSIYHVKQLFESLTGRVEIEHLSENTFGAVIPNSLYLRIKHSIDFLAALFVLPVVLPVLAICAAGIKITGKGPAFFTQSRVGFGGHIFTVYKLRTMVVDSGDQAITDDGDQRITPIGRFLRSYRLDEMPQVLNILRGEMSWIGPRPEAVSLSAWYEREIPFYPYRHTVRPGISGWAQVHQGHVAKIKEVNHKLQYDFFYIKNLSAWLDVLILFKTIKTIFTRFGAR